MKHSEFVGKAQQRMDFGSAVTPSARSGRF